METPTDESRVEVEKHALKKILHLFHLKNHQYGGATHGVPFLDKERPKVDALWQEVCEIVDNYRPIIDNIGGQSDSLTRRLEAIYNEPAPSLIDRFWQWFRTGE